MRTEHAQTGVRLGFNRGFYSVEFLESEHVGLFGLLQALAEIPGVKVEPVRDRLRVSAPRSVWQLSVWRSFCEALDVEPEPALPSLEPVVVLRALFPHQQAAVEFLASGGGGYLADPPGLGKTASAAVAAAVLRRSSGTTRAIAILGPPYVVDVWRRELQVLGLLANDEDFEVVRGTRASQTPFNLDATWWFIPYHLAPAWQSRLVLNRRGAPAIAILDEAHWLKRHTTARAKAALVVSAQASARILLSGTPVPNRLSELWSQLSILDGAGSWGSKTEFALRYCGGFQGTNGWVYDGEQAPPEALVEFRERLRSRYLRRTVESIGLTLPPLRRQRINVELSDAVLREQESLLEGRTLGELLRLVERGSSDALRILSALRKGTSAAKIESTVELVEGLVDQSEQVVVFAWQRASVTALTKRLNAQCVMGGLSEDERDAMIQRFQQGRVRVLVATLDALREGVTLDAARCVVLHDLDWTPASVLQAEARIYRLSQRRACVSYWCLGRGSFDEFVARHLVAKALQNNLVGLDEATRLVRDLSLLDEIPSGLEAFLRALEVDGGSS